MSELFSYHELILSIAKLSSGLLLAFAAAPLLKRPELRATLWAGVLIVLPVVIVVSHGRGALDVLPRPISSERVEASTPVGQLDLTQIEQASLATEAALPQVAAIPREVDGAALLEGRTSESRTSGYVIVYYSGLALALLPLLISLLQICLMRKKSASDVAMAAWEKIRPKRSRAVSLYLTDSPSAPFTAGVFRAAVFLPESCADWSLRRLKSTLHHEAAHIRRKDPLVRVLASLVRALLWFHPLVWLAHRQLVIAQEEACDEIAMAAGIAPEDYAEDLLETVKGSRNAFAHSLHMARWSQLGSRVQSILTKDKKDNPPMTMKNKATAILGVTIATSALSTLGFSEIDKTPTDAAQAKLEQRTAAAEVLGAESNKATKLDKKLDAIVFQSINFQDATIEEAIEFLRQKSTELDSIEKDESKKGLNFVVKLPTDRDTPIVRELRLKNVPLRVALKFICEATEMNYEVTEYAVSITSPPDGEWEKAEK